MGMQQGYVEVEFNGEVKLLRFDFNAIADIEEYFGKGIASIMDEERVGFSTVRALYWGGLKWKIKGLTIERAGAMIQSKMQEDGADFKELMQPIVKGLKASGFMGKKKDADDEAQDGEDEPKN
jgi:hypothetical protein